MSRSIHDTRRFLFEALHGDFADPELQDDLIRTARRNLRQQRSIKDHVRQQRKGPAVQVPPLDPEQVPILTGEDAPFVHHPATAEDLRAVMRRLPPGSLDGLNAIECCLGGEGRGGQSRLGPRDPYTGFPGREVLPGVYVGLLTGDYQRTSQTIRLFAQVGEPQAPHAVAIVQKLLALVAFMHEAAHHFGYLFRVGGSRWRMDDRDKNETYASRMGSSHAALYVIPYLEERYAAECAALAAWLRHHGGAALPLVLLIDRRPGRHAPALRAVRALAAEVLAGRDQATTRVHFARALHHAGHHDFALAAVARVLAEHPAHPGARSVRACIAACSGELALAESICHNVLAGAPDCADALAVLSRIYHEQQRWTELAACATRAFDLPEAAPEVRYRQLARRAQAWLALGRWDVLAADIATLRDGHSAAGERAAAVLTALMLCRQQRWAAAHAEATQLLSRPGFASAAAELAAVRFESAHRLGSPPAAGALTERQLQQLRAAGHATWVDRLVAAYGLPAVKSRRRAG